MVRFHNWSPFVVNKLYLDSIDHEGLYFWRDDVRKYNDEIAIKEGAKKKKEQDDFIPVHWFEK